MPTDEGLLINVCPRLLSLQSRNPQAADPPAAGRGDLTPARLSQAQGLATEMHLRDPQSHQRHHYVWGGALTLQIWSELRQG